MELLSRLVSGFKKALRVWYRGGPLLSDVVAHLHSLGVREGFRIRGLSGSGN